MIKQIRDENSEQRNIRKFHEAALVQLKLEEEGVEQVYIDEFSASSRYNKHYGWAKVGEKGYVKMSYDSFSMFFIVAFSRTNFYGIQGSKNAMVSENVLSFLDWNRRQVPQEKDRWIICDNASIHICGKIKDWISKNRVTIVTISPYSPSLNPAEIWIAAMKANLRRELEEQKIISLMKIQKIVDNLSKINYQNVVRTSRKETLSKWGFFNNNTSWN